MLWVLIRMAMAEAILMSIQNIGFYEDLTKIIFESNTHLIYSAGHIRGLITGTFRLLTLELLDPGQLLSYFKTIQNILTTSLMLALK